MRALDLIGIVLHWLSGLVGVIGCLTGLAALPGLFDLGHPDNQLFVLFNIPFSKAILEPFAFHWQLAILAGGVFLYAWLSFLFLFSTHLLVSWFAQAFSYESDGAAAAWTIVLVLGVIQVLLFVVLLYGIQLNPLTIAVGLLVFAIMSFLFVANYTEGDRGERHVISYL